MRIERKVASIFPEETDIPQDVLSGLPVEQNKYLIRGELWHWRGGAQES